MPRYIEVDKLLEHECEADKMGALLVVGKGYILDAPGADVVPVVHGKWVHGKKEKLYYTCEMEGYWEIPVYCSECKYDLEKYGGEESNYCPNCGAKMKGAEHE